MLLFDLLLFWVQQISAGLNFVKETYFLAVDLHDRFLLGCGDVSEGDLPLLGTTALFLAAKVEVRACFLLMGETEYNKS